MIQHICKCRFLTYLTNGSGLSCNPDERPQQMQKAECLKGSPNLKLTIHIESISTRNQYIGALYVIHEQCKG